MKSYVRWFLVLLLLGLSRFAVAAESSMISVDDFADMIQSLKAAARMMSPYLVDEGIGLTSIFFGIGAFILLIKLFFGPGDPGVKANIFLHVAKAVLVIAMLASWVSYGSGPNQEVVTPMGNGSARLSNYKLPFSVENLMVDPFDGIVNGMFDKFGGGGGKEKLFNVIAQSWAKMWEASDKREELRNKYATDLNPLSYIKFWLQSMGDKIITFLFACVVALLALLLMVIYVFVIYLGDILAFLGMFVGPLMLPSMLFPPFSYLSDSWFKFMISAGFFKIIAAWTALVTMKTVEQIQVVANKMYEKMLASAGTVETIQNGYVMGGGLVVSMIMTVVYMAFAIFLMVQVWKLTDALMQGRGGLGISALDGAASKLRG
ncbi:integral membrane protein (PIN domain superfamily) [Azospira oryzae PS]|jgi:hypothetical protein|uniref:Integral membrane protein (PIN domain superfamily) n=1 Tax=Azospira oryzae (strain ATCC BAA-33 / DSM 13638 / PS) TaxID=640081 RepID=G8QN85_AZOOP|nr:type IV secretion system protein [Azospira oryzae]AEV26925.1 integral membrane protein (PIN domain superfamily) [Azospira oryzae PS]